MKEHPTRKRIIQAATFLLKTQESSQFHMRNIAKQAGIALGTVYNYFENKEDMILALAEDFWIRALAAMEEVEEQTAVLTQIHEIYEILFREFSSFESNLLELLQEGSPLDGERKMQREGVILEKFRQIITRILDHDQIAESTWTEDFTKEELSSFICGQFLESLKQRERKIDFLLEILRRLLLEGR